jgi:iron(III) transport system ATP-binding protein
MRDEIRSLQQSLGLTVAYVTHDQSEALAVSDQIIVMEAGTIAQAGSPEDLYDRPCSEFVAGFMGEAMLFEGVSLGNASVQVGSLQFESKQAVPSGHAQSGHSPRGVAPDISSGCITDRGTHQKSIFGQPHGTLL